MHIVQALCRRAVQHAEATSAFHMLRDCCRIRAKAGCRHHQVGCFVESVSRKLGTAALAQSSHGRCAYATHRRNACQTSNGLAGEDTSDEEAPASASAPLGPVDDDTIAAVVSGGQGGSVAIIRVSGHEAVSVAGACFRQGRPPRGPSGAREGTGAPFQPKSHTVLYGHVVRAASGALIDEVLLIPMLAPRSYTREDVVELHCHGGGLSAKRVLDEVLAAGARLARPGEFTLRAFLNGRLDLTQAESVMQLISARTVTAADSALAGLQGGLGDEVLALRREVLDMIAEMEARLDFDEELPALDTSALQARIASVQVRVEDALRTARRGRLLHAGLQAALVGRPNVGKSSLLNAVSASERAIVTDVPGTTRDVVDVQVEMNGIPVTLLDTAGIRDTEDRVEAAGVQRSRAAALGADVVIFIYDAEAGWTQSDACLFESLWPASTRGQGGVASAPAVLVANKCDLVTTVNFAALPVYCHQRFEAMLALSARAGTNLARLEDVVERVTLQGAVVSGGRSWAVNERQSDALFTAHESLLRVSESIGAGLPIDFWTIDMRDALHALGSVTGDSATEDVLDLVFSKFCIGK